MVPPGIPAVDCWIGFPAREPLAMLEPLRARFKDAESRAAPTATPHLFAHETADGSIDPIEVTLAHMDRHGIALGLVQLTTDDAVRAVRTHPDRFRGLVHVFPHDPVAAVRTIRRARAELDACGVYLFPAGANPPIAVDDAVAYPVYAACCELDLAVIANAGAVGPRVPSAPQDVERFDRVCHDFPELRIVMCHGAEPDEQLAVDLMATWPGLHLMTSGFAPRHYPSAIVDYAGAEGRDKILYAGYYPYGLTLERIFAELADLPLGGDAWPRFLSDNARRVFVL